MNKSHHYRKLALVCDPDRDVVWRVEIRPDNEVHCMYIGVISLDQERILIYDSISDAPEWIQDRIAVLRMLQPSTNDSIVYNVGRRISENVFWIVE